MLSEITGLNAACTFASVSSEAVPVFEIPSRVVFNQLNILSGTCSDPPSW